MTRTILREALARQSTWIWDLVAWLDKLGIDASSEHDLLDSLMATGIELGNGRRCQNDASLVKGCALALALHREMRLAPPGRNP